MNEKRSKFKLRKYWKTHDSAMEEAMECCTKNSSQFKQRSGVAHTSGVTAQDETTGCVPFPLSEEIFKLRAIQRLNRRWSMPHV
jgi:hypothetical protein